MKGESCTYLSVGILVEFLLVWESGSRRFCNMSVICPTTVVGWVYSTRQEFCPTEGALSPIRQMLATAKT